MSNDHTTGLNGANEDGDLRDPALRRALDHAPDHDARPDPRIRDAILKMAHNLAPAAPPSAAANNASAAPWWRRLFGGGDTRSRMPWNAAFASVLVATFVAVLWHREPIPDAQLDGEARVGGATVQAPAAAPTPPSAEPVPQAPSPATVAPQAPASPAAEPPTGIARDSAKEGPAERSAADAVRRSSPPPPVVRQAAPDAAPATAPSPEIEARRAQSPSPSPAEPVAPAPAPPAPITTAPDTAEQSARARKSSENESAAREKRSNYAAGASAPSAAAPSVAELERSPPALAAAPAAAAPPRRELADSPSAFPGQGQANAEASGGLRPAPAPRAAAAAKAVRPRAGMPSFAALDRWTAFDFTRAGLGVRHARGDIEGLAALVNTVARSATAPDAPLALPVEARLSLYEGGTLIAVLEIAGDQVRWTPQPGGVASVGTPPAQALAAMRALLTR